MPNVKISSQFILKENTAVADLMLRCCFESHLQSTWPDQVVLVDNGCSDQVRATIQEYRGKFEAQGVSVALVEAPESDYQGLRNLALSRTPSDATHVSWHDADEVLVPEEFARLKVSLQNTVPSTPIGGLETHFYHFVLTPRQWQFSARKDNIFAYHPGLKWSKGVHEKMTGVQGRLFEVPNVHYLHFGYCKRPWRVFVRWLHYALLEFGNVNAYKKVNENGVVVDYLRDWRTPNGILDDRIPECRSWIEPIPEVARSIMDRPDWEQWVAGSDDESFWLEWQERYKREGNWTGTLDWAVARLQELRWKLA